MSIPQTAFGRTSRFLFSGAKLVGHEIAGRLGGEATMLKQRVKQAQELVRLLGQLKGAALKGGQIFSQEFADLLPKEMVNVLRQLQDNTAFMPIDQVRYILSRELGAAKVSDLEGLSEKPIAAASIGQVHRATLHGKPVAIKVQYPGVAKSIDADLATLKTIVQLAMQLQGNQTDIEPAFCEIVESLKRECNYYLEAAAMERYRAAISDPRLVIPQVYSEYSAEQVLTLSFEPGQRLTDWISSKPSLDERMHVAEVIGDLLISEFLEQGIVQTDPNFGNFLYRAQERQIVLLDFGATVPVEPAMRNLFLRIVLLAASGDVPGAIGLIESSGMVSGKESPEAQALFLEVSHLFAQICQPEFQPFAFNDAAWLQETRVLTTKLGFALKHTPPPKETILLLRKLAGMLTLLRELEAAIDVSPKIARLKASAYGDLKSDPLVSYK